jgi:two-component system, NtrC family, sensor kinase
MTSETGRGARRTGPGGRRTTRRRLAVAFGGVLASLLLTVALQRYTLRRIDGTIDAMERGDEQLQLTLQLESALHEQRGLQDQLPPGAGARMQAYQVARQRALDLLGLLRATATEGEEVAELEAIERAAADLDVAFREEVVPAAPGAEAAAAPAPARSHPLVSRIEQGIDDTLARLEATIKSSHGDVKELERTSMRLLAGVLAATVALVALAVTYLSRSVARPLALLSEGAAALGRGDLDARIAISSPDEFGALAAELNAMAASLKEHQARLVESEKAAGIGRLAAGFAHEINNPLQVMLGYLSLNRDVADPRLAAQLGAVEEETRRCEQIVEGLLELTRPREALVLGRVDLRSLCDDVVGALRALPLPAGVRLAVSGTATAQADRAKLRQAVFNLVKNAVEAAGPGGAVAVEVGASEGSSYISVSDTGPGVSAEQRTRLFEPFFTTKASGTGLGLAVSRAILRVHGGDIALRNAGAAGAHFVLSLPEAPRGRA